MLFTYVDNPKGKYVHGTLLESDRITKQPHMHWTAPVLAEVEAGSVSEADKIFTAQTGLQPQKAAVKFK